MSVSLKTFKCLYDYLREYNDDNIIDWLKEPWEGKDKQESLLRLFSGLGLINKLKRYDVCKGNFNKKTIERMNSIKDIFYSKKNKLKKLKDKGDSSDLTCISKEDDKKLLVTTSKNLSKMNIGDLDIDKILTNFEKYKIDGYSMTLCICINDRNRFNKMKKNVESSNMDLKKLLEMEETIIIDWNDLNDGFKDFKLYYSERDLDEIIDLNKKTLCLKMHQYLGVKKTLRLKNDKKERILWGHIQRSGKSYIIGGCIIEDSKNKKECNYLVITTAPNETIEQQVSVFDCIQLSDFNIYVLNGNNKNEILSKKNIIICSKQFLQSKIELKEKTKNIGWLKKMRFDMRFIDESHNGGTTELAQKTLDYYGGGSFTVQITATYSKPINDYNIERGSWILWDLEDIKLCKDIERIENMNRLIEKHGEEIIEVVNRYSLDNIKSEYSRYPSLWLLTDKINDDTVRDILNRSDDNSYGWSLESCFLLKESIKKKDGESIVSVKSEFQNELENLKIWYRIFGKRDKYGIPEKEYGDDIVFMKRIERICKNPDIYSRFIGDGDYINEPMIIMCFLPQKNISKISEASIKLLERNKVIPDYDIISINSKTTTNPKESIEEARVKARNSGKKGVLVLSGRQCSLGVSIDNCDIVLLLNNNTSFDMIYQMMFRCMTEGKNKSCGFVVDLNIHRVIETSIINYASLIKPDLHPREGVKHIFQERLINLNGDHWMYSFGNSESKINMLCKNVYDIYSSNTENALNQFLSRLRFKQILLTKEEQKIFNVMFSNTTPTKEQKEIVDKLINKDKDQVKKGIEKISDTDKSIVSEDSEEKNKNINYMDILKHIIPLICLLTIHNDKTSFVEMFNFIENDKYVYDILLDQTKSWWGKSIDSNIIKKFINVYIKYMKDDKETNQIIRTVKELFIKNVNNNRRLSKLIDKYLIPQELEKKSNAEVSTPYKLRREMLDKIPLKFWTKKRKVFEPCSGKGGFIVDIINRFMEGLDIEDEKERYKVIVEECLYFSDINPTNIFICKLLIDPYDEYELNYNEGDTLKLDIKEKWDIEGFDAVIGNPPYNSNNKRTTGVTLWQKFIKKSLIELLNKKGYLCFVNPASWRKPVTTNCNYNDELFNMMCHKNQLIYLSIHNTKDGIKTFKCGTRYDWYVIKKMNNKKDSIIRDEKGNELKINLLDYKWLPNYNYDL